MDYIIEKTESICSVCKKAIEADIVERAGSVYMRKSCMEHGDFEKRIAKYAWYYKGLNSFHDSLFSASAGNKELKTRKFYAYILFLSSRCNLNCPICLTNANVTEEIKEISLDALEEGLSKIRGQKKIIRLSGGEPTLREDLPQIIRLISRSGNIPFLFTNGIKLLDLKYLKELKKSGLSEISTWVDSLKEKKVYDIMRGNGLLEMKAKILTNIKQAGIPFGIYHVKVKGVNDADTADCLEYVERNSFVKTLWIRGYTYLGKKGFSASNEFTMDELIEEVARYNKGLFTLEDVYFFQKILYVLGAINNISRCYLGQVFLLHRKGSKSLAETFRFEKFSKIIDEFQKRWLDKQGGAKKYFLSKFVSRLANNLPLLCWFIKKRGSKNPLFDSRLPAQYFTLILSKFYNSMDYDKRKVYQRCPTAAFNKMGEEETPFCASLTERFG